LYSIGVMRHPGVPRFHQRDEGSRVQHRRPTRDRSLRRKNGFVQDGA
jgi:hypothetical protein